MPSVFPGLLVLLLLGLPGVVGAACGDDPDDAAALAATRVAAEAACDCCGVRAHRVWVRCVARAVRGAVRAGTLRRVCRRPLVNEEAAFHCPLAGPAGTCPSPPERCRTDADCQDDNFCTHDACREGICEHVCLCIGPGGIVACCPGPAALCVRPRWFYTCGDPVCRGHAAPGIRACRAGETAGTPCASTGDLCDPGDDCDRHLRCASADPTGGGHCPISSGRYKDDVRYLTDAELRRVRDTLLRFPLATYRYKTARPDEAAHLGFVIEDIGPSPSVDADHQVVDLYGYTTMAVAAIQTQAHEIEALRRRVASLERRLAHGR